MARYAACFRPRLYGQLAHCQQYVKGLFHACRSNVERMNERLPDSSYDALHHFISISDWNGPAVMDEVARQVQATLGAETCEVGLLLDESGWEKAGTKSVGVTRQYIGQVGKLSNGQVGVFAVLSRGPSAGLVGGQLYLPAVWGADAARCEQARIPLAARAYRSKSELAAALVKHLLGQGLVRADWVGGDAAYGNSPALRQALQQQAQAYVLDVGPGLQLYQAVPTPAGGPVWSDQGRPPRRRPGPGLARAGRWAAGRRLVDALLPDGPQRAAGAAGRARPGLALGRRQRGTGAELAPAHFPRVGRHPRQVQPLLRPARRGDPGRGAGALPADAALLD